MIDKKCELCKGEGWVCENHLDKPWREEDGCCCGAGKNCLCNPGGDLPDDFVVYATVDPDKVKTWSH